MKRIPALIGLALLLIGEVSLMAQGAAGDSTQLPGKPFFIKKTWMVGGEGNWDYLTFDPDSLQLFVAHGPVVEVIDVSGGTATGQVTGMRDAHGIALDDTGELGFVSDGPANQVRIFDRRSLDVVASVPTGPNPRSVVYEPATKLVFAICTEPVAGSAGSRTGNSRNDNSGVVSVVTVIDAQTRTRLADILLPGRLGYALADGRGQIYINIVDRNRVAHFDAQSILSQVHTAPAVQTATVPGKESSASARSTTPKTAAPGTSGSSKSGPGTITPGDPKLTSVAPENPPVIIDWSGGSRTQQAADNRLHSFPLGAACRDPRGLAIDSRQLRLFTACGNMKMEVLNADNGDVVATLPIGAGTDAIAYDAARGLIYTANGAGLGSLSVIRQSVTDSYAVIQELPTRQRARTLAVNPASGEVYLVTNLNGFDLTKNAGAGGSSTLPVVETTPVKGSFQIVVIGN